MPDSAVAAQKERFTQEALEHLNGRSKAKLGPTYYFGNASEAGHDSWNPIETGFFADQEGGLLEGMKGTFRDLAAPPRELVDFGPGNYQSLTRRAVPIARATNCTIYVAIDISQVFLDAAHEVMSRVPGLTVRTIHGDFFRDELPLTGSTPRLLYMGGSTISNLPVDPSEGFPTDAYRDFLRRLHRLAGPGGYLLLGWHAALNASDATATYARPEAQNYLKTPLRVLKEWGANLNLEDWSGHPEWLPDTRCVAHYLIARTACRVAFAGQDFDYPAGHRLLISPSYKIPTETMADLLTDVGFSPLDQRSEPGGYALWLLKSVG